MYSRIIVLVNQGRVIPSHGKDCPRGDSETKRHLPENGPKGKEQDWVGEEREHDAERNLHLRLGFELVLDQPGSEDPDNVNGQVGDQWEQEKGQSGQRRQGILDQEPEREESIR